jgi:hypothetical protein
MNYFAMSLKDQLALSRQGTDDETLELSGTSEGAIAGWVTRRGGSTSFKAEHASNYAEGASAEANSDGSAEGHRHAGNLHEHAAHRHRVAAAHAGKDAALRAEHEKAAAYHEKKAAKHHGLNETMKIASR